MKINYIDNWGEPIHENDCYNIIIKNLDDRIKKLNIIDQLEFAFWCVHYIINERISRNKKYNICCPISDKIRQAINIFKKLFLKNKEPKSKKLRQLSIVNHNNKYFDNIYYYDNDIIKAHNYLIQAFYFYSKQQINLRQSIVNCIYEMCKVNSINPKIYPTIKLLYNLFSRKEKQFNIKEHNDSEYEKIIKIILKNDYFNLKEIDKMQAKDIIEEFYDIEIEKFDFYTYKTIQREFKENS